MLPSPSDIFRLLLVAIALFATGGVRDGGTMVAAQDDPSINVSGIVIDYGDGQRSYALVPYEEDQISGIELLRRSGLSLLTVEFGGMGEGVCAIEATGCDLSACRARLCQTGDPDSPFWNYVRGDSEGGWQPAPLGATSSIVEDGDVDGWFWTGTAPLSPALTLDAIAQETGTDLGSFASTDRETLEPVVTGTGDAADRGSVEPGEILAGIAIVATIAIFGGFLVTRSRQPA